MLLDEIDSSTDLYEGLSMVYQEMKDPVCPFHKGRAGFCKYSFILCNRSCSFWMKIVEGLPAAKQGS
jgi:hypothetical protein